MCSSAMGIVGKKICTVYKIRIKMTCQGKYSAVHCHPLRRHHAAVNGIYLSIENKPSL